MAKLPRRPDVERLRSIRPDVSTLERGTVLHRIYSRGGDFPTLWSTFRSFGPLRSRFDHHVPDEHGLPCPQERSILYAALDVPTAFAEVFQHDARRINRTRREPWLASFELGSSLNLLDLTDTFALRAGASMKLATDSVSIAQHWSRAFHDCYDSIHGVRYRSSPTGRPCVALYERAAPVIAASGPPDFHRALADPLLREVLVNVAQETGYTVL